MPARNDGEEVVIRLTKPEARALLNAAETGLRVIEALSLVQNLGLTEAALNKLRAEVMR